MIDFARRISRARLFPRNPTVTQRALIAISWGVVGLASVFAQDSAPVLMSRTSGNPAWSNLAELKAAADKGNPKACAELGEKLLNGDGVPPDGPRALTLLEQAARAGQARAAFRLGMLFDAGENVERDRARAVAYFHAAAAGGVPEAFRNVGVAYSTGHGVKRDYAEAYGWLLLAKKHGTAGTVADDLRAHILSLNHPEWIAAGEQRAPAIERELAQATVASLLPAPGPLEFISAATSSSPPVKLVLPSRRVMSWSSPAALQREADHGDATALAALGQALLDGRDLPADPDRAVATLQRAAQAGSADAAYHLAELYTKGLHVARNETKAFSYTLQAANGGVSTSIYNLGALYANGSGTKRDFTEALAWMIVAKHYNLDSGNLQRIRDYVAKTQPDQVSVAEHRAAERIRAIDTARDAWGEP